MRRLLPVARCLALTVMVLASACSGPTKPTDPASNKNSSSSTSAQPPTAVPKGNLLFAGGTPAPGSTVTISPSAPTQASLLTLSFSATFDSDLPDVAVQVQLLDVNAHVCASATSPKNSLAANATITFTVTGVALACALPLTTESVQASLVPASGGNAYGQTSIPAQYAFKLASSGPPPAAAPDGITLVNVTPASGSEFVVTGPGEFGLTLPDFRAAFGVVYKDALPDAKFEVELLDASGTQCSSAFLDHPISPAAADTITAAGSQPPGFSLSAACSSVFPQPLHIAGVRATLLTLRGPEVNGHLTRTVYLTQTFPLAYTINRYPPVPPNAPATPPTITGISWINWATPSEPIPVPGDNIRTGCGVTEADGVVITITLTVAFDGAAPLKWTGTTPVAASSSPGGAAFGVDFTVPPTLKFPPPLHAKVTCDATNPRGETASKSIDIGAPR